MSSDVLSLLPDEQPIMYQTLASSDRAWRGRVFLMVWILYGHEAYSWSMALAVDPPYETEMRRTLLGVHDQCIIDTFGVAWAERRHW